MAGFQAGQSPAKELPYDFTAVGGSSGIIPEPTQGQVEDFRNEALAMAGLDSGDMEAAARELASRGGVSESHLLSNLCSGTPPVDELRMLSSTDFQGFFGYVVGAFVEQDPPVRDTRPSPARMPSGANATSSAAISSSP